MPSPLQPSPKLLVTLASIAILADREFGGGAKLGADPAFTRLLEDRDLQEWLEQMDRLAFLPVKR